MTPKELRQILCEFRRLTGRKGHTVPRLPADALADSAIVRELRLADGRSGLMTDVGFASFKEIVSRLDDADLFDGLSEYADIWGATLRVIENCLSTGRHPNTGSELVRLVREAIVGEINEYTHVVPIFGLELKAIDECRLGTMRVVRPTIERIEAFGLKLDHENLAWFVENTKSSLWLIGTSRGTARAAKAKFQERAQLATGMLAVVAASLYQHGAYAFRIGIAMTPEESCGRATFLSWNNGDMELNTNLQSAPGQHLPVDAKMRDHVEKSRMGQCAFSILGSENRNPLEEAIVRALYWYSDAHRDTIATMRLLKYWSCVETFFSIERCQTTRSVIVGLAATLAFGEIRFLPHMAYRARKARLDELYQQRSDATHGAAYGQVSERDVADFSQWVSWMLINIVSFVAQGYLTPESLVEWALRQDAEFLGNDNG